ncbi:membrane protein [Streptomyces hygroscopicus]|uniref:FxsA family membrane protein n=1 Tax=Streptomyces hygroscopicus TaxID=1912 RepID=UPI0022406265|nr:FxsA family membrane protein [Streptomyces hygroscopicus]MCW7941125.1 membrane protein [Streptomyces hygroscopicus]
MTTGASTSSYPARPRRSRLGTFLPLGIAAWLVLEIWLLTLVAGTVGGITVFLLLVAGFVLGSVVIKRAGRRAFRNLTESLQARSAGSEESGTQARGESGNGLTMLAGLLLMLPGLISDVAGLLLLLPPVQKTVRSSTERTIDRKLRQTPYGSFGDAFQQARIHRPDGKIVQGEVIRDDTQGGNDASPEPRPPLTR